LCEQTLPWSLGRRFEIERPERLVDLLKCLAPLTRPAMGKSLGNQGPTKYPQKMPVASLRRGWQEGRHRQKYDASDFEPAPFCAALPATFAF